MSFVPAVPPLPQDFSSTTTKKYLKPPIPPLPPNFNPHEESQLAAPMPERAMPSLPADITRTLDDSLYGGPSSRSTSLQPGPGGQRGDYRRPSPAPSGYGPPSGQLYAPPPNPGYPGGFARPPSAAPPRMGPSPAPYGSGGFAPQAMPSQPFPGGQYNPPNAMGAMSLGQQRPMSSASYPSAQQGYPPSTQQGYPQQSYPPQAQQGYPPPAQQGYPSSPQQSYPSSPQQGYPPPHESPSPRSGTSPAGTPALTAPLPTPASLVAAQRTLPPLAHPAHAGHPAADHVSWIRDVLFCAERTIAQQQQQPAVPDSQQADALSAIVLHAPLPSLLHSSISILLTILSSAPVSASSQPGSVEAHVMEAVYIKGVLYASDPFLPALASPHANAASRHAASHSPMHAASSFEGLEHSPRLAFQSFSTAARLGFLPAWFKLGRDYELVGDIGRAKDCFERGAGLNGGSKGEVGCLYRLGMAHLLSQLSFPASPPTAVPFLHRAALQATLETPQPAYVYGLILLGEFDRARVPEGVLSGLGLIPRGSSPLLEARRHIERAAFLGFAPAQYKLGHAYEYAVSPFPFDPLLSVQYYSLASQQGESEADMALSKWFLCGAESAFEKDEALALTFAEKAARKGLGSAEFAMGYYAEVGVGGLKDIVLARKWYAKAVSHGNPDAPERLRALSQPAPQALSRTEHDAITDAKLVRTRTQARITSQNDGRHAKGGQGAEDAGAVVQRMKAQAQNGALAGGLTDLHAHGTQYDGDHAHDQYRTVEPSRPLPQQPQQPAARQSQYQPQAQPQIPPSQARYSLTDSPAPMGMGAPTSLPGSPTPGRAAGRPPGRRHESSEGVPVNGSLHAFTASPAPTMSTNANGGPGPGYGSTTPPPNSMTQPSTVPPKRPTAGAATFEEMGFKTGKAEDKECVIM